MRLLVRFHVSVVPGKGPGGSGARGLFHCLNLTMAGGGSAGVTLPGWSWTAPFGIWTSFWQFASLVCAAANGGAHCSSAESSAAPVDAGSCSFIVSLLLLSKGETSVGLGVPAWGSSFFCLFASCSSQNAGLSSCQSFSREIWSASEAMGIYIYMCVCNTVYAIVRLSVSPIFYALEPRA